MKVHKPTVSGLVRQLTADWTVEYDIDESMFDIAVDEIKAEMDWLYVTSTLKGAGWVEVFTNNGPIFSIQRYNSIREWCEKTLKGQYKAKGDHWLFESKEDAAWFALRWAS